MTVEILPGSETFSHSGSSSGVLILHGFTGSPASMRSLAERLAGVGYSVELPRLPGHGTSIDDLMTTGWSDWTQCAEASYARLLGSCERVAIVGLSMGGGVCAYMAERHDVAGCVFINPLVKPLAPEILEGLDQFLDAGVETVDAVGSDIKKEGPVEVSYDKTPLGPAKSLFAGLASVYENLKLISAPILVLSSREDHVVSIDNGDDLESRTGGTVERIWLEDSYHVATMDNDRELVESSTVEFLARVFNS